MYCLAKINHIYYFRFRIPQDLRRYFGRSELKRSLKTKAYSHAKSLVKKLTAETERIFTIMRSGVLTDEEINRVAKEYIEYNVENYERLRNNELQFESPEIAADAEKNNEQYFARLEDNNRLKATLKLHEAVINKMRMDLARKKGAENKEITYFVDNYLAANNIKLNANSPEYIKFCNAILAADIRINNIVKEHTVGNYETDYDIEQRNKPKYITLKELIELYEKDKGENWKAGDRTKTAHRQILHILGNISINNINRQLALYLSDSLKIYPKKLSQSDLATPWQELSEKNQNRLSPRSQHYIKTAFSTLIKYAKIQDLGIKGNPAEGIAGVKPVNEDAHTPYTTIELQNLIHALAGVNKAHKPEMFWIPLLLLFTGARSNEICMLRCCDIEQVEDIWIINFRNRREFNQSTKNNKDRTTPIHNMLIKLGFLDYVIQQREYNYDRLFSNLELTNGKWNVGFGKQFNRTFKLKFLKGYDNNKLSQKTLHSFRKSFTSWFIQAKDLMTIPNLSILQSIIGHFEAHEITFLSQFIKGSALTINTYGGGYGKISEQSSLIQKLNYDVDFNIIYNCCIK